MAFTAFVRRHPISSYYVLAFAISWGAILMLVGPVGFVSMSGDNPSFPAVGMGALLGPGIAGLVMIGLVDGRGGLRDFLKRLGRWRVGARWYVIALGLGPLVTLAVLLPLSMASQAFLPALLTADDVASLIVLGVTTGLMVPLFEETGWTGFVTPRLLATRSVLATGLGMGLLWGAWHFPLFAGTAGAAGAPVPTAITLVALLFGWLPPYRVLMVWLYARTRSVLLAMLMHMPIVINQYVINPKTDTWQELSIFLFALGAALWAVVGVVMLAERRGVAAERTLRAAPQSVGS